MAVVLVVSFVFAGNKTKGLTQVLTQSSALERHPQSLNVFILRRLAHAGSTVS